MLSVAESKEIQKTETKHNQRPMMHGMDQLSSYLQLSKKMGVLYTTFISP